LPKPLPFNDLEAVGHCDHQKLLPFDFFNTIGQKRTLTTDENDRPKVGPGDGCGMVERFNGRINELLRQTRFESRADLKVTLLNYLKLYNYHIPQRAIGGKTPFLALKEWQQNQPELFVKRVYNRTGLDS